MAIYQGKKEARFSLQSIEIFPTRTPLHGKRLQTKML